MGVVEELLSLDLEDHEYVYRIRRDSRIVYISVHPDVIASADRFDRTDGSSVLKHLRNLPDWNSQWSTLLVSKTHGGFTYQKDSFQPHRLSNLSVHLPLYANECINILDLAYTSRLSDRVSTVRRDDDIFVLKIARFEYELRSLHNEIQAYGMLKACGFTNAPRFIGYVYEETKDRIIGFLMEYLHGRQPEPEDLHLCQATMRQLHEAGIVHGDLHKPNIVVSDNRAKFIDFEVAIFRGDKRFTECKRLEMQKLADVSGLSNYGLNQTLGGSDIVISHV